MNQAGGIHAAMIAISMMLLLELKGNIPSGELPRWVKTVSDDRGYQTILVPLRKYAGTSRSG